MTMENISILCKYVIELHNISLCHHMLIYVHIVYINTFLFVYV